MTFYVIRAGDQYFSSGGGWVNTSGLCDTATWVGDLDKAWCTSSLEHAEAVANYNGGWPESLDDVEGNPQAENQSDGFYERMADWWKGQAQNLDALYREAKSPVASQHYRSMAKTARRGAARCERKAQQNRNSQEDDTMPNGTTDQRRRAVKVKRRVAPPSANYTPKPPKDDYTDRQQAIHKGTAKAASYLHLAGGAFLGVAQTCFRRTFLSFVAAFALIGGMILASIGYAISLGFLPASLFPDNQSIGDLYQGLVQWFGTAQPWQLWGCAIAAFLAVVVQCFQSWSIYTAQNAIAASKTGGKSIFSNRLHRFLFYIVAGLVWYLDFETISGVSFAAGVAGFALWLWAAFPSEIAAMILQIQKSAKED